MSGPSSQSRGYHSSNKGALQVGRETYGPLDLPASTHNENDSSADTNKRKQTIESFLSKFFPHWQNIAEISESILTVISLLDAGPSPRGSTPTHHTVPVTTDKGLDIGDWANSPFANALKEYKYSLIYGTHTEFNPSGIWVVQDCYNDMDE